MDSGSATSNSSTIAAGSDGRGGGSGSGNEFLGGLGGPGMGMFGQSTGVKDLLLGSSGFGGSLGNGGYGGDLGNSNVAPSSSNASSAFDINDFPSLRAVSGGGVGGATNTTNNGLVAALRQQQLLAHQQQMQQGNSAVSRTSNQYRLAMASGANGTNSNFNMTTEDFPALPGAPPASGGTSGGSGVSTSPSLLMADNAQREMPGSSASSTSSGPSFVRNAPSIQQRGATSGTGIFNAEFDGGSGQLDSSLLGGPGAGGLGGLQQSSLPGSSSISHQQRIAAPSTTSSTNNPTASSVGTSSGTGAALNGDYGLLGLLGIIRMTDADRNALALGSDLTLLGLNLNSSDKLYSTFASPWSESATTREPHYQLPMCYYMQPPALKTGHLSKFELETLFYIFYALPKDVLQAYAAQELYTREWRYHVELKLWFKRAGPAEGVTNTPGNTQHQYFDINTWERRLFSGSMNQNVASGFLSEEDVRVKFSSS